MDPDDFKQAWKTQSSQTRLTIDAELLLKDVRRNQRCFAAAIFWRDVREVGTSLLLVPLWLYLGVKALIALDMVFGGAGHVGDCRVHAGGPDASQTATARAGRAASPVRGEFTGAG